MAVRFIPNLRGIALIGKTPAMTAAMVARAGEGADAAKAIAPRGAGEGGHYADQISADPAGPGAARINAWKFTSGFIEFGTSDTPVFAPLRTGCDAAGLTLSAPEG